MVRDEEANRPCGNGCSTRGRAGGCECRAGPGRVPAAGPLRLAGPVPGRRLLRRTAALVVDLLLRDRDAGEPGQRAGPVQALGAVAPEPRAARLSARPGGCGAGVRCWTGDPPGSRAAAPGARSDG